MKRTWMAFLIIGAVVAGLVQTSSKGWGSEVMSKQETVTQVLKEGERLGDTRITELKTYKTPWEFEKPASLQAWKEKKEAIRRTVLVAAGLWPMPEPPEVQPEVFERKEHDDYTVEKVLLPTFPGYYATGNLYRPKQQDPNNLRRYPGILCPHGHWEKGRFEDTERASVPARAISFARQGYVCFTYDMVGYADNKALIDHGFGDKREALWGISPAGFQLYTSLRALEFIRTLPDVEANRIGCTGASGGGTQTFLLYAVDDRIKVAAPVNMISAHMQGGCKCENLPFLRHHFNNMDIGATLAPRALMMVCSTGDWTKNTPQIEFPAIKSIYDLYKKPDYVAYHLVDAEHNYNKEAREAVYTWFGKWFYRDRPASDFVEQPYVVDATPDLAVFTNHPIPADALKAEDLFASLRERHEKQIWNYLEHYRNTAIDVLGTSFRVTLAVQEPKPEEVTTSKPVKSKVDKISLEKFLLKNEKTGQSVPANLWVPAKSDSKRVVGAALLVSPQGKAAFVAPDGKPVEQVRAHLDKGIPVLTIDCLGTGEFIQDASWTARLKAVEEGGGIYFPAYNLTDTQGRVQDILLAVAYVKKTYKKPCQMTGLAGAGGWTLLAHGLAENSAGCYADLSGLDFTDDKAFTENLFIPNLRRAGDFVTAILLGGNQNLTITGLTDEGMKARIEKAQTFAKESGK
jgi:hypothetical protein